MEKLDRKSPRPDPNYKTEVLYGAENAVGRGVEFMANVKKRMDLCYDHRAPSIVIEVAEYRDGYLGVKSRGGKIRVISDITKENLHYCKKLMDFVELRHLAEVKGGLAISESEYMATTVLEEAKPLTQVIYSNVPEVVAQGQHIFNTFWDLAAPAEERIKELEEGISQPRTRIIEDPDNIRGQIIRLAESSGTLHIVSSICALQAAYDTFLEIFKRSAARPSNGDHDIPWSGIRWISVIDRDNITLAKQFLDIGIQMRHVSNLPPVSFALGDKELDATIERIEDGAMARSMLTSNDAAYLEHFGQIFQKLWDEGIDASDRIKALDSGAEEGNIEIIRNHRESIERSWNAISAAHNEVLILFSTPNAFRRQLDMGAISVLQKAYLNGCSVRILVPSGPGLAESIERLESRLPEIVVRTINEKLRTNITIVVVDSRDCFIFELRDDTKDNSYEAIGLAIYSNSRSIISSYNAIIESLWRQTDLYEQLEAHDRMQREFINIATHELRTPIQPILGLSEILSSRAAAGSEDKELLNAIWRNAKRLNNLAEAILDVTKIESHALNLRKDLFDLNELISTAVNDVVVSPAGGSVANGVNISVIYADSKAYVLGDKDRILQVISNLLANAVKFTVKGEITVLVRIETDESGRNKDLSIKGYEKRVTVRVKDSGQGIRPEMFSRLFTKFATGSNLGTGLGLYISKGIIDAHGGNITATNNEDGKGATFAFSIPYHELQSTV